MSLPNLIIAGAPKCGTSSLYFWLAAHPEVCASRVKETFYFADKVSRFNNGLNFLENGLDGYSKHFSNCGDDSQIIFEATAPYIYFENALREIPNLPTVPKVIFILREPSKRLMSHYLFEKHRTGRVKMSFAEYVSEEKRMRNGHYAEYLKKWKAQLGEDRMRVYIFEEFMADTEAGMKVIADFLNITSEFYSNFDFTIRNQTLKMRSKIMHQWGLKLQPYIPHWIQDIFLPIYLKINGQSRPTPSQEELNILDQKVRPYYKPHVKELEDLLGREIAVWK